MQPGALHAVHCLGRGFSLWVYGFHSHAAHRSAGVLQPVPCHQANDLV